MDFFAQAVNRLCKSRRQLTSRTRHFFFASTRQSRRLSLEHQQFVWLHFNSAIVIMIIMDTP